jgi:superfamily I DNA/RNA helicase
MRVAGEFESVPDFLAYVDKTEQALDAARKSTEHRPDVVTLMTIHRVKGLQFTHVFVAGCVKGIMPHAKSTNEDEERRIMFVALTRAKDSCLFGCPRSSSYDEDRQAAPSPFLEDMGIPIGEGRMLENGAKIFDGPVPKQGLRLVKGGKQDEMEEESQREAAIATNEEDSGSKTD